MISSSASLPPVNPCWKTAASSDIAVNFLPIRVRLIDGQSVTELLQQVKRTVLDAYDHQTYTYGTLVHNLKLRRDPSRLPLVEVQFNLEKVGANLNFPGLQVEVDPNPKAAVNFDLFVNVVEIRPRSC